MKVLLGNRMSTTLAHGYSCCYHYLLNQSLLELNICLHYYDKFALRIWYRGTFCYFLKPKKYTKWIHVLSPQTNHSLPQLLETCDSQAIERSKVLLQDTAMAHAWSPCAWLSPLFLAAELAYFYISHKMQAHGHSFGICLALILILNYLNYSTAWQFLKGRIVVKDTIPNLPSQVGKCNKPNESFVCLLFLLSSYNRP